MGKLLFRISVLVILVAALVGIASFMRKEPNNEAKRPEPVFAASDTDVLSPDGKVTLTMKEKRVEEGILHTFLVSGREIFSKTLPKDSSLLIPFNAFSPDNKYIFLKESVSGQINYFVLPLVGGGEIAVSGPFNEKFGSELTIDEATGWGGINLLIINTRKVGGGKGSSYWFEAPGGAFIRLSHTF